MTTTTTRTDRYGFPVRTCTRCGGSGHHSFNLRDGDTCWGCSGTGLQHTPKAAKAFTAWREAVKAALRPMLQQLAVGDEIRDYGAAKGSPFTAVVAIEVTAEQSGSANGQPCYWTVVTLADGRVMRADPRTLVRRNATVDVAQFVAVAA
jgi:hypothetical protein